MKDENIYKTSVDWIIKKKKEQYTWDEIKKLCVPEEKFDEEFQKMKCPLMYAPMDMTPEEWIILVSEVESSYIEIDKDSVNGIYAESSVVSYPIPSGAHDAWVLYEKKLEGKLDGKIRMSQDSIKNLTESCNWLLNRIRKDTREKGPQKGLVMGSVQSGKTAAMIGLVTMAAHYDWNFIIILSGTIENLRVQTRDRFINDISRCQDADWHFLESSSNEDFLKDISDNKTISIRDARFNFSEPNTFVKDRYHETYVMICLKQASRLDKLLHWLHSDKTIASRLRILIIDDEADQASINTANMTDPEKINRTAINNKIMNLANGVGEDGTKSNFQAINYISFTATPYANVLNEAYKDSLYPKDFIMCLPENNSYFGSKAIWGSKEEEEFPGMDIIRPVPDEAYKKINKISKGDDTVFPKEFEEAVAWFICCVAALRIKDWKKPISMLIHTSIGNQAHFRFYEALKLWFEKNRKNGSVLSLCREVYEKETSSFSYESLVESYSLYEDLEYVDKAYPTFEELIPEIQIILNEQFKNIEIVSDDNNPLEYSETGIHVCVDNCSARKYADDSDIQLRIIYPNDEKLNNMKKTPAFIVIGGNTLSRGLTIEGLVCTFFTRNSNQADSLMQMARWYGYRKGYELYPRIWMTPKVIEKYKVLELVDEKLRKTLSSYKEMGKDPKVLFPAVMSTSSIARFLITAKNKSQFMVPCSMDYSCESYEVTEFIQDSTILKENLNLTEEFLCKLGEPEKSNVYPERSHIWKNISTEIILEYIFSFKEYSPSRFTDQMRDFISWFGKENENGNYKYWNVAVCGSSIYKGDKWIINGLNVKLGKVERTKLKDVTTHIDIGSMRSGKDGICDIDADSCTDKASLNLGKKGKNVEAIRGKLGYSDIPLLLIYCISKDGGKPSERKTKLGIESDLIGYSIIIGGEPTYKDHIQSVVVSVPQEDEDDIEE
jgi:hypothetical protein